MAANSRNHHSRIRWVLIIVLVLNWAVAAAKMIYGMLTRCESMTADGFHSFSDGASNIVGLIGIAIAARPRDSDHPYGHKKYETFYSLGIAFLLFLVSFNLFKEAIGHIIHPVVPQVDARSFAVMIITLAVNIWVMRYEFRRGKALQSDILVADSMHTRADILTSFAVILALFGIRAGYPMVDPIATFIISLFITYAGITIVQEASRVLCDSAVIVDTSKISDIVFSVTGVKSCHKIRTRGRPDDICIDLHVQVDSSLHVDKAHDISYAIEQAIKKSISGVTDVLVHIEPKNSKKK